MKLKLFNISIGVLYAVLTILIIKLVFTAGVRYSYANVLSISEKQLEEILHNKVAYLNSQAPYLNYGQNRKNLDLIYCVSLKCIDSLEDHYQEKLKDTSIIRDKKFQYLYTDDFNHWNKLKSLMRLKPIVEMYTNRVMTHNELFFDVIGEVHCVFSKPFLGVMDYDPVLSNNLLSINNGPFIRDTSQWFAVPYSDTLKFNYFKDNYSYGFGRDSILNEYVYDISHLREN